MKESKTLKQLKLLANENGEPRTNEDIIQTVQTINWKRVVSQIEFLEKSKLWFVEHATNDGTSFYPMVGKTQPTDKEIIATWEVDFEPDKGESLEIGNPFFLIEFWETQNEKK